MHSYNFDVDWYSSQEFWLVNLGKDLVYWLTDGTNLPGFAPTSNASWAATITAGRSSRQGRAQSNSATCVR